MPNKKTENKQAGAQKQQKQEKPQKPQQQEQQQPQQPQQEQQPQQQLPPQPMPPFVQGPPPMVPPPHPMGPPPMGPPMVVPPPGAPMVPPPVHSTPNKFPRIDRTDDDNNYYVYADVPGLTKDQIKVEIKDNMLVLSGERKSDHLTKNKKPAENKTDDPVLQLFPIIECFYGPFQRSIPIPADGDISTFKTKIENGVLEIVVKKSPVKKTEEKKTEQKK